MPMGDRPVKTNDPRASETLRMNAADCSKGMEQAKGIEPHGSRRAPELNGKDIPDARQD
jgi:hypothetical protein